MEAGRWQQWVPPVPTQQSVGRISFFWEAEGNRKNLDWVSLKEELIRVEEVKVEQENSEIEGVHLNGSSEHEDFSTDNYTWVRPILNLL